MLRTLFGRFLFCAFCLLLCGRASAAPNTTWPDGEVDPALVQQILSVLDDAVITRLDARVSLDKAFIEKGKVRLEGLALCNLEIGVQLNARGAQKLAALMPKSTPEFDALLQIARLGLFNRVEIAIRLKTLRLRRVNLDARDLDVRGFLLQVGATPPDPQTGKVRSDSLSQVLNILRHTALNKIKVHVGLDRLAASLVKVRLEGAALEGFFAGATLARDDVPVPEARP